MAKRHLHDLQQHFFNDLEIEEIDVIKNYRRFKADKITLFPAIKNGDKQISGLLLSKKKIHAFLQSLY